MLRNWIISHGIFTSFAIYLEFVYIQSPSTHEICLHDTFIVNLYEHIQLRVMMAIINHACYVVQELSLLFLLPE